jgi:hypothetical protein
MLLVIIQAGILYLLFQKSIETNGDIVDYLEVVKGNLSDLAFDFEPISFLIFKVIGIFPESLHFSLLYFVSLAGLLTANFVIFSKTRNSISWIIFYGICVMPFACAINLRTGYGFLFLLLLGFRKITLLTMPLFHVSLGSLLLALRVKFNLLSITTVLVILTGLFYFFGNLIINKVSSYLLYYLQGESIVGIIVELAILGLFTFYFLRIYQHSNKYVWVRVLLMLFIVSLIFSPIAVISSRFITLIYLVIIMMRINSIRKNHTLKNRFSIKNMMFSGLFFGLILFRFYRTVTMFGYLEFTL